VLSTAVFVLIALVAGVTDWWAVGTDRRRVEVVAKPLTMAALVGVAAVAGSAPGDVRLWLVVGALLGLVGDIALLGDGETAFMVGLGAFAVGHLAYAFAAMSVGFEPVDALAGALFTAALLGYRFIPKTLPGARDHGGPVLAGAVVVYAGVISLMVITAWGSGEWMAAAGATLFALSDWVLGYQRFVGPLPGRRLSVHMPYHVGQALLILGLATA
jgi:uncharacterized membrane protein YhhN